MAIVSAYRPSDLPTHWLGVRVSPEEAQLLMTAKEWKRWGLEQSPARQRRRGSVVLLQAAMKEKDIQRVSDWKAAHPNG